MIYTTHPLEDQARALDLYRSATGAKDRANDYFEVRAAQRGRGKFFSMAAVAREGNFVGLLEYGHSFLIEGQGEMGLHVQPAMWHEAGARELLSDTEAKLKALGCAKVRVDTSQRPLAELLRSMGYEQSLEIVESELDLHPFRRESPPPPGPGLRVVSWESLLAEEGEAAWGRILPLLRLVLADIPGSGEAAKNLSIEKIKASAAGSHFLPPASLFLEREGKLIGVHNVVTLEPDELRAGVTGIVREERRKGHMRVLKRHGIVWGAKNGYLRFRSDNEINNPMLLLNMKLGFRETGRSFEFLSKP